MPTLFSKLAKGAMVANLAVVVRLARCGRHGLSSRLRSAFDVIDPFDSRHPAPAAADRPSSLDDFEAIPEVSLNQLVHEPPLVCVDSGYSPVDGSLGLCDLLPLLAIARDRKPAAVLEIGTSSATPPACLPPTFPPASFTR